jgi:isopenicillin-N epimerase
MIDHVTSPTGLILPINEIIELAHGRNIRVMIDGAHAPGMIPVNLLELNADYYTANHHKWLCGPKTSGFLHVRPDYQHEVRPTIISHGANHQELGSNPFLAEFNWVGTYDPTPILAMPTAIDFLCQLKSGGLLQVMNDNRTLVLAGRQRILDSLDLPTPAPEDMIGSLGSIPLAIKGPCSAADVRSVQQRIYDEHQIEVPIFLLDGRLPCIRISAQAYNALDQYERLAGALHKVLRQ